MQEAIFYPLSYDQQQSHSAMEPGIALPLPVVILSKITVVLLVIAFPVLVPVVEQDCTAICRPDRRFQRVWQSAVQDQRGAVRCREPRALTSAQIRVDDVLIDVVGADIEHVICTVGIGATSFVLLVLGDVHGAPTPGVGSGHYLCCPR